MKKTNQKNSNRKRITKKDLRDFAKMLDEQKAPIKIIDELGREFYINEYLKNKNK